VKSVLKAPRPSTVNVKSVLKAPRTSTVNGKSVLKETPSAGDCWKYF
jgi:hypothetical protein